MIGGNRIIPAKIRQAIITRLDAAILNKYRADPDKLASRTQRPAKKATPIATPPPAN